MDFGYGYGYGYDTGTGYGYDFGYGYGYGYGYGAGGGHLTYIYNVTIDTTSLPIGNYNVVARLNTGIANKPSFNSPPATFKITQPASLYQGAGGSGSFGGSGVISSEPIGNIEKCGNKQGETIARNLVANNPAAYSFTPCEGGVYEIVVIGNENENDVALKVEHLHGLSKRLTQPAPEKVYYYLNVWSGTKNIKEAIIRFKVENSWLAENNLQGSDIKMLKWKDGKWVQLDTIEKSIDATHTYLEARTDGFSHFVVTGSKGAVQVPSPTGVQPTPSGTARAPEKTQPTTQSPVSLYYIVGVIILIGIGVAVLYLRKK